MRIVTLNTWKNEGDYARRLAAMTGGLRALQPDVVLLQEVFRTLDDAVHTGRSLGAGLGLELAYAPARTKLRRWENADVPSESGLAVLVRGRVWECTRLLLPSDERGGERIALLVAAEIEGRRVHAGCMHLSHLRHDDARRRQQLESILAHSLWQAPADLRVLGGDCNATRESPALAWLVEHPSLAVHHIFAENHQPPTHPLPPREDRPGRAIDHLFCIEPHGAAPSGVRTARAGVALDEPIAGTFASDHAAVFADVTFIMARD